MKYVQGLFLLAAIVVFGCRIITAKPAAKDEILRAAQNSYYNLPKQGLSELTCSVIPDWAGTLRQELKSDVPADNPALKLLNGIHFWVSVSETGKIKLSHQVDTNPSPSQLDDFQKAISGTEEQIDGFWKSAAAFLLTSALPNADSGYELSEQQGSYVLSYREGNYDILTTLAKDYSITEIKVTSATLTSSLKPKFTKSNGSFLLAGYDAEYEVKNGGASHLSTEIQYQEVEGLLLPSDLIMRAPVRGTSRETRLHLTDCQVKRH